MTHLFHHHSILMSRREPSRCCTSYKQQRRGEAIGAASQRDVRSANSLSNHKIPNIHPTFKPLHFLTLICSSEREDLAAPAPLQEHRGVPETVTGSPPGVLQLGGTSTPCSSPVAETSVLHLLLTNCEDVLSIKSEQDGRRTFSQMCGTQTAGLVTGAAG